MRGANLEKADLFKADLLEADLSGAVLFRANLSGASVIAANFTDADVTMLRYLDRDRGEQSAAWWQRLCRRFEYRRRIMRGRYQSIRGLDSCNGNRIFVHDAADQDYLDTIESQWHRPREESSAKDCARYRWARFWFWAWGLTDYGRGLMSVVVIASILICIFGTIYRFSQGMLDYGGHPSTGFTPYYFSIVTYTTLGFGDVRPTISAVRFWSRSK